MNSLTTNVRWDRRSSVGEGLLDDNESMFRQLFERSADAIFLFDPGKEVFVDCNQAAVEMMRASSKRQLLMVHPANLSPGFQPDGKSSREKMREVIDLALSKGSYRFEWRARRMDETEFPLEVLLTPIQTGEHPLMATVCRDITNRKHAEREILELNASLEQRVADRTAALTTSEARLRALVEHAPEAIVVFDGDTGRFLFGNEHACRLYGVPMEKLATLTPEHVSPEFQPSGRRSSELAREKMDEALAEGTPVYEWIHRRPDGQLLSTEVRLLRLPAKGQNLIRASIIDNTERKRAERALRESEEKFRALFEVSSQGVTLHDENQILQVNPAAVRILGCQNQEELLGKHPSETSPPFQANGESSAELSRKYIRECMDNGSARFEWTCRTPQGNDVPLEVAMTRIEWSGRQLIQAFIMDISERKRTEEALRQANRELHREIAQRTRVEESLKERVRISTLNTEVALALNAATELRTMLQQCAEMVVQHLDVAFARVWMLNEATQTLELQASAGCYTHLDGSHSRVKVGQYKIGLIALEKKPHLTNSLQTDPRVSDKPWAAAEGMVAFAGYPLLLEGRVLGVLAMFARRALPEDVLKAIGSVADAIALGIERKRAQTALAESEARFNIAFQASPVFISMFRVSDETYVLANDALLNWLGGTREEVLGRTSGQLGMWENPAEREVVWRDLRTVGSIRQKECRWRNRQDELSTVLLSAETITVDHEPHVLSLVLDISERKSAEVEMLKALAREKELSQLKSNFVSMVSHEFRTPLGIIQSSAELLDEFLEKMKPEERQAQLESIFRNTRRMAGMMEEILVLSRLDAGKLDFKPALLDLNAFFRRVADELLSATNRRCTIQLSLRSVPSEAKADERLLGHIFTNLLSNAVKYSEPGATVHLEVACDDHNVICIVRDQGIGISENDQHQLFKAFHRGGNVGTRPGTGLGLLVVKRCVELHGGMLELKSRMGEGTTVTVKLPVLGEEA